ncbi:hypothetical protein QT397_02070 (plasmid) [Microbulbifer sp. MKSA007]|nr:hypothetical protein QT397_02070 [Microbulbifer sp. MKSA007]
MSSETPMQYDDRILSLVDIYSSTALEVQYILGSSSSSIAALGSILEEYNDRFEGNSDTIIQYFGDAYSFLFNSSHGSILEQYNYIKSQNAEWRSDISSTDKFRYPVMLDVGVGNVQIYTAIGLLEDYNQRFPSTDPLNLKKYNEDYSKLALDLDQTFNTATVKFASLMIEKGLAWGAENVSNWNTLDNIEKEAFAVYFFNVGEEYVEKRRSEKITENGVYNVDIEKTDIAQEYIQNGVIKLTLAPVPIGSWPTCLLLRSVTNATVFRRRLSPMLFGSITASPSACARSKRCCWNAA